MPVNSRSTPLTIGIVGPCAAGKSTLIQGLKKLGYTCRHIAQEHSYVANMWQRLAHPDVLIYLQVSYPVTLERRQLNWTAKEYEEQLYRLRHARQHAHLIVDTDRLAPEEVLQCVTKFMEGFRPNPED